MDAVLGVAVVAQGGGYPQGSLVSCDTTHTA